MYGKNFYEGNTDDWAWEKLTSKSLIISYTYRMMPMQILTMENMVGDILEYLFDRENIDIIKNATICQYFPVKVLHHVVPYQVVSYVCKNINF